MDTIIKNFERFTIEGYYHWLETPCWVIIKDSGIFYQINLN